MSSYEDASFSNLPKVPRCMREEFKLLAKVKWSDRRWTAMAKVLTATRQGKAYLDKLQAFGEIYRSHYQLRTLNENGGR